TQEDYIEYTIDLGDTSYVSDSTYLATDVQRESRLGNYPPVASDNGWRRYRIPLYDSRAQRFGSPNLTLAKDVRVWLQGVGDVEPDPATLNEPKPGAAIIKPYLVLGSLDIVGSRWQVTDLGTGAKTAGTTQTLNAINNLDNADIYAPPFEPGQTRSGNQEVTRREQSISLEFTKLQARDSLEAFKTFSLDEDYSRYRSLVWYIAAYDVRGSATHDSLRYFIRFSSDEIGTNYYEYSATLPPFSPARSPNFINWTATTLRLTDISNLKLNKDYHDNDTIPYRYAVPGTSIRYAIKGRPSFTRLRRVSFGLIDADTAYAFDSGQLWFDELRATDIAKDVDKAGRMLVNGNVANLMRYTVSLDGRGADFLTVGQNRGTGNSTRAITMGGTMDVHRFFEGTGIIMPATYNYSDNSSKPRFTAGDDVVRLGAAAEASLTRTITRSWNVGYSRVWTDRSNPFLRFWLSGLTASVNGATSNSTSPSAIGHTANFGGTVNYGITPRRYLAIPVPITRLRIYPLPERAWWNYSVNTNSSFSQARLTDGTIGSVLADITGRVAGIDYGADTRPIDILHHHIEAHRNLTLPDPLLERIGFINLGHVVSWRQNMDASYTIARGGDWIRPTLGWNGGYTQANGPELSPDLSIRTIGNGQTMRLSWDFPFERLPMHTRAARDSTHPPRAAVWRRFLSRLGTISADAQFNQSSAYSRVTGTPSFVYLFGLSGDPGISGPAARVSPQFGNQAGKSEDWRASGRTRVSLLYGSNVNIRADWSARHNDNNGVITRQATQHFPSLEFDYGQVARALRLDRILRNPQLRSSYDRARTIDYLLNSTDPSTVSTSANWQPLLGVTGDLRNGTRTDFQLERRVTQDENHTLGNSLKTTRNTNVRFSLSRSYTQGQKVNILGKETVVKSSVGLGMTATYSRNSSEVRLLDASGNVTGIQSPTADDRLAVNGTGSYGFSSNVTGNVMLGFGQNRDLQRNIVSRNVVVELRASFTF
ncbi:MAG TPA: hypothetical protein VI792_10105, partial [Candidatus Eisenbacteria bacterium]